MFNCYAFNNAGERVIIDLGLPYAEAIQRCEGEAVFLRREFGLTIQRLGDDWYEQPGWLPRIFLTDAEHDVFALENKGKVWLPEHE